MKIDIPYLDRTFPLEIPDENLALIAEPNDFGPVAQPETLLREALANGQPALGAFLAGARSVLVIINDATRPTPTAVILSALLPAIADAGISADDCTFLIATGAHRAPTEDEYRQILGGHYDRLRSRCFAHNARNDDDMADLGRTRNGTPIVLNKLAVHADRIIATGSVEPHYFAGFTGGRKAFLPGIASFKTIEANHKQALLPKARSLALDGNPVHEDMMDALPLIKAPVFSVMTVLDKDQKLAAVYAGSLEDSFYAAVKTAKLIFCVDVPGKADIVVSVARFPMDIDLYQSQKAIDNGAIALKDGGTLILVSSCRDGIGDEAYAKLLSQASSPAGALQRIGEEYRLGYHKAAKMAEVSARAAVVAVSELGEERLASMFIEKAPSPQAALDKALQTARNQRIARPQVLVLPDGCLTVPHPVSPTVGQRAGRPSL
jgi:nickel-dependent lactate racemase